MPRWRFSSGAGNTAVSRTQAIVIPARTTLRDKAEPQQVVSDIFGRFSIIQVGIQWNHDARQWAWSRLRVCPIRKASRVALRSSKAGVSRSGRARISAAGTAISPVPPRSARTTCGAP
ncbi:hypothetical protein BC2230_60193 [Burkholderia cepacia]